MGLCTNTTCVEALEAQPPEDRIRKLITSPSLTLSEEQLKSIEAINDNIPENDLIIVSGVSSNHYDEMQAMFRNLHEVVFPKMKNFSMVLFDLGLTAKQRNETEQNCRCQVLRFPFPKFDRHIKILRCYGFKPLIIRAVMFKARKLLVWQDSSVRWNSKFVDAFDRALRFGQQVFEKKFSDGVTHNTVKQMFDYLDEKVCAYQPFGEVSAGIQMLRNDPLIVEALLNPWARCALEKSCMCPTKSTYSISTCKGRARLHRCHRFDQSAYSLLLAKLYGMERYKMIIPLNKQPCGVSRGGKESNYFSSLQANDSHNFGKAPTKQ